MSATGAVTTVAFLPAKDAGEGLTEAAEAGIRLAVSVTEGVEAHDLLPALALAKVHGMRIIGPNTPGLLIPAGPLLGFLPSQFAQPGDCAVVSKSGTLSYEVVWELRQAGLGLSLWVVIGGDQLKGSSFSDIIRNLPGDGKTRAIVMIGEIGGSDEEDSAPFLRETGLPVVALIAGRRAPTNRTMGHAGAMIAGDAGRYSVKVDALEAAGAVVISRPSEIPAALGRLIA